MAHSDRLDPDNCARCQNAGRHLPRSGHGLAAESKLSREASDLLLLILCHWDDPDMPAEQLDRWDARAEELCPTTSS